MLHAVSLKILVFIVVLIVSLGWLCRQAAPRTDYEKKIELLELMESMNKEYSSFNRQKAITGLCADAADQSLCIRRLEVR